MSSWSWKKNWQLKILAVFIALILWLIVSFELKKTTGRICLPDYITGPK